MEESITQSLQQAEAFRQSILKKAFEGRLMKKNMKAEPYTSLWKKWLPIINIQLKKSLNEIQLIELNKIDFIAVGDRDKSGFTFNLEIEKGKVINDISGTAVARDLYRVLINDLKTKDYMKDKKIKLSMGKDFILKLKTALA